MAAKKTKVAVKQESDSEPLARKTMELTLMTGQTKEDQAREYARMMVSPELAAYRVLSSADSKGSMVKMWGGIDVPSLTDVLRDQAAAVNRGELNHIEAMLMNQATALQSLFARLAESGMSCDTIVPFEANLRMALRAQSQCRATLETLAAIKNPPIVFAKQANINQGDGNQQVNNGTSDPASHAGEIINQQSELLEAQHGERMDTRTAGATIVKNPAMATLD